MIFTHYLIFDLQIKNLIERVFKIINYILKINLIQIKLF